jgi:hypothetical protein
MNYNMEDIQRIAQEVVKLVQEGLRQKQSESQEVRTMAEFELGFREALRQIGVEALGIFLSRLQQSPESEIVCGCGGRLHYQRMRPAVTTTVFGKVAYTRAYYAGCSCGKGVAPLDRTYGLEAGGISSGLGQLMALAGIAFSFEESEQWLKEFLLFEVSENSIRSETQKLGHLQQEGEELDIQTSQNEQALQARLREERQVPKRLYGSIDAATPALAGGAREVRIEPRARKGKPVPAHEDWRDMKVGCWYQAEAVSALRQSARQRQKAQREGTVFRTTHHQYYCDIAHVDSFGKLVWATGCHVSAELATELVFVCDGATWIWDLVEQYYPNAVQIVDWYHAEDRLQRVADAVFPSPAQRQVGLAPVVESLWQGQVEEVVFACKRLARQHDEARQAATYFANNHHRMRYDVFRTQGYLIGSGTIESGCKQIVTQRLKRAGAQWIVEGAVLTAKARAAWLSGNWHTLCQKRARLPLAI